MKPNNKAHPVSQREEPLRQEPLRQEPLRKEPSLDHRYGKIGISAVAAAVRYQSEAKKPADAPAAPRDERWLAEATA
jgi:hypothetical protein